LDDSNANIFYFASSFFYLKIVLIQLFKDRAILITYANGELIWLLHHNECTQLVAKQTKISVAALKILFKGLSLAFLTTDFFLSGAYYS
jgi:hypothetical protein